MLLGDRDIYIEVFYREKVTGRYIWEAIDIIGRACIIKDPNIRDFSDSGEDSSNTTDVNDPNVNSNINLEEVSVVLSLRIPKLTLERERKRGIREREHEYSFDIVIEGIEWLANSSEKIPRAEDIRAVVKDLQERFVDKVSADDIVKIIEKLASPI